MKSLRLAVLLTLPLLSSAAQARNWSDVRASGVLRLATSADFEPFNFLKNGQFAGFEVDLGELVGKQLGLKVVWVKDDFDSLLGDFDAKDYDAVIASHAITSTRAKLVDFTQPHYCTGGVALAQAGGPLTSKAMAGRVLAAESGSTYMGYIQKLPFDKKLKVYGNSQEAIQAVATGQVSAVVTDKFAALQALADLQQGQAGHGRSALARKYRHGRAKGQTRGCVRRSTLHSRPCSKTANTPSSRRAISARTCAADGPRAE